MPTADHPATSSLLRRTPPQVLNPFGYRVAPQVSPPNQSEKSSNLENYFHFILLDTSRTDFLTSVPSSSKGNLLVLPQSTYSHASLDRDASESRSSRRFRHHVNS